MLISKFPVSSESTLCQWLLFHFYTVNMFTAWYAFIVQDMHISIWTIHSNMFILHRTYEAITVNYTISYYPNTFLLSWSQFEIMDRCNLFCWFFFRSKSNGTKFMSSVMYHFLSVQRCNRLCWFLDERACEFSSSKLYYCPVLLILMGVNFFST